MVYTCKQNHKMVLNPVLDWTDSDVWEFIKENKLPYCELYDRGYKRIGCVGCPMSNNKKRELELYPIYKRNYLKAFEQMLENRKRDEMVTTWETAEDVMNWWISE